MDDPQLWCLAGPGSPVADRARVALDPVRVPGLLAAAAARGRELVAVSTCNRTELYGAGWEPDELERTARRHLGWDVRVRGRRLAGAPAVEHLLRVGAGLESAELGDAGIVGQLARAHTDAGRAGAAGPVLGALLSRSVRLGRRVRRETGIAAGDAGIGAAVRQAVRAARPTVGARVAIVGAGRAAAAIGRALATDGDVLCWLNRTPARAAALAASVGGQSRPLGELAAELAVADAVVLAVSGPVLAGATLARAVAGRSRPLLLVDAGMPPALEVPEPSPAVHVVRLDDLSDRSEAYGRRLAAVPAVEAAVAAELHAWRAERHSRALAPAIASLYLDLDAWLTATTAELVEATPGADPAVVAKVLRRAARRFAHSHVTALRRGTGAAGGPATPSA